MAIKTRHERTRSLLKDYRSMKNALEREQAERKEYLESYIGGFQWFNDLMRNKDPDLPVEQIQHTSDRTEHLLCSISNALEDYRDLAFSSDFLMWRSFDVIYSLYFSENPVTVPELCRKYHVTKGIIYSDINKAIGHMSETLFPAAVSTDPLPAPA